MIDKEEIKKIEEEQEDKVVNDESDKDSSVNLRGLVDSTTDSNVARSVGNYNTGGSYVVGPDSLERTFIKIRSRRQFFDYIKEYIREQGRVRQEKLIAYVQYTTGSTYAMIVNALEVLKELDIIEALDEEISPKSYLIYYRIKENN